ncbi:hypothetical protein [Streptomyces sp. SID3343]|uniref:hypothetical protein n=1 Tax=Streptomyces sp. SID3343 TaxID=2690260 RepID=UPI001367E39A|nr:hypothetical protein [Streptomyces sp. SID3343]MYW01147.1 hypothetical protein [Streptomyces sp. SID3343]
MSAAARARPFVRRVAASARGWARAYTVLLSSLALAATLPAPTALWVLAHPHREGFHTPEPVPVGDQVALVLALTAVNAAVLCATAFGRRAGNHFAYGH